MDTNGSELSPAQAGLRFLIELAALVGWGVVGWQAGGALGWLLAAVLPLAVAVVWGTFRAPGDHSAGGAPVTVPGVVRLFIGLDVLVGAAVALALVGHVLAGAVLAAAVVVHNAATWRRVRWLLNGTTGRG